MFQHQKNGKKCSQPFPTVVQMLEDFSGHLMHKQHYISQQFIPEMSKTLRQKSFYINLDMAMRIIILL